LIAREDIQIINVCSPNNAHGEQVLAAMAAGKHLYCEKPLVVSGAEAARVAAALPDYRGISQMTLQCRFFPATLRAKQLMEEGFVGEVIGFRAAYLHSGSVDPARPMGWKQLKSEGGGVLQDLGTHVVDLMEHLVGPFAEVLTEMRILYPERPNQKGEMVPVEADDQAVMLVRLGNGALGTIEASKIATGTEDEIRFEIHGTKGALRFNSMQPNYLEAYDLREPETPLGGQRGWRQIATVQRYEKPAGFPGPKFSIGWIRSHMHCLYTFLDAVARGRQGEPSLRRGLELQRMLATAEKSAETRSWVRL
jgi:predicted dehydrogenase